MINVERTAEQPPGSTPPSYVNARVGSRIGAYLIDAAWMSAAGLAIYFGLFAMVLGAPRSGSSAPMAGMATLLAIALPACSIALAAIYIAGLGRGQTPGMKLAGVRLVHLDGLGAPGFWRAAGRNVVFCAGCNIIVGPFSPLFDDSGRNRGWHDKASNTWVVDDRHRLRSGSAPASEPSAASPAVARTITPVSVVSAPRSEPSGTPAAVISHVPTQEAGQHPQPPLPAAPPLHTAAARYQPAVPSEAVPPHQLTGDDDDLDETRVAPPARDAGKWVLLLDTGQEFTVQQRGFIGRNPSDPEGNSVPAPQLIRYADESKSVSKMHLSFGLDSGRFWVEDRGSTNGTKVVRAENVADVRPRERTYLEPGDVLSLGERKISVVIR